MMKRLYFFTKICFFIVVISVSIYLKEKHYLTYIVPSLAFNQIDYTDYIIQFNEFSNVLIVGSLLLLIIFFIHYRISIHLSYVTLLDKTILFYFFIYFIICTSNSFLILWIFWRSMPINIYIIFYHILTTWFFTSSTHRNSSLCSNNIFILYAKKQKK